MDTWFIIVLILSIVTIICKGNEDDNLENDSNIDNNDNLVNNGIFISGESLKIISIAFGLFGILFIANTIMCCYNCYAFSLYWNKRKHKVSHFNEDGLDDNFDESLNNHYSNYRINTF